MSAPKNPPAFARPAGWNGLSHHEEHYAANDEQVGMTLRDYFAAHAPTEPLGWFEPRMPPQPEPAYDHDHPGDRCYSMIDGSQLCAPVNAAERRAWRDEYNRQYSVQWPYAWADAQLAVREQK